MRGRLRVYEGDAGDKPTWTEVPREYWSKILDDESEVPVIPIPKLAPESEIPQYKDDSIYFSLKLHHGGEFNENLDGYVGGKISYFDNCSEKGFGITDMESMVTEIGLVLGDFCLWFCLPDTEFVKGLIPVATNEDVESLLCFLLYSKCLHLYTTSTKFDLSNDYGDFSLTQLEEDERIERIEAIREECDYVGEGEAELGQGEGQLGQNDEEDKLSWEGDNSNLDSTDSEVEKMAKKKRRIPPPNPPYRTRRKGRYSMLRGLFKNTEDTPVILDDDGPPPTQPTQDDCGDSKGKGRSKMLKKKSKPRKRVKKVVDASTSDQVQPDSDTCIDPKNQEEPEKGVDSSSESNYLIWYQFGWH